MVCHPLTPFVLLIVDSTVRLTNVVSSNTGSVLRTDSEDNVLFLFFDHVTGACSALTYVLHVATACHPLISFSISLHTFPLALSALLLVVCL